ncbi:MAG TPA: hypothetical protein VJY33_12350 [Isosphaeraceae bacterium]|nr:hypothetical protein [Isosphaeraceae bacterium]
MADRAVQVEKTLVQVVQCCTALEDEIGAVFDLADEQAIPEPLMAALAVGEEGDKLGQPAVGAGLYVRGREPVGQLLQPRRVSTGPEGVGALVEGDALLAQPVRQPLVAVEADAGAEGEVGADAQEHPAEVLDLFGICCVIGLSSRNSIGINPAVGCVEGGKLDQADKLGRLVRFVISCTESNYRLVRREVLLYSWTPYASLAGPGLA